jgi:drug/metabolite transporter, DME family
MRVSHSGVTAARKSSTAASLGALVAAGVLWGTGGPLGSLLSRAAGMSALAVATYRLLAGGAAIMFVLAAARRGLPRGAAVWRRITVVGLLSALYQASYFTAIALTSVSMATLITIGATPVLVVSVEIFTGRQRVTGRVVVTVLLAVIGLGLLAGLPPGRFGLIHVLAGTSAALLSAAGFAAVTLLGARPVAGLDELTMTGAGFTLGGVVLIPLAAAVGGLGFSLTPATLGLITALGLMPTATAYLLYFRAMRGVSAGTAALLSLTEPLTATLLGVLFLGNRLDSASIAGTALLAAAVLLASAPQKRAPDPPHGTHSTPTSAGRHIPGDHLR